MLDEHDEPMPWVMVYAEGPRRGAEEDYVSMSPSTGRDGRFRIEGLPNGSITLGFLEGGYSLYIESVDGGIDTVIGDAAYDTVAIYESATARGATMEGGVRLPPAGTVENAFFRYESIIGDRLRARSSEAQAVGARLASNILNRMFELGRPGSGAVGH